jgi:hypothetical protein
MFLEKLKEILKKKRYRSEENRIQKRNCLALIELVEKSEDEGAARALELLFIEAGLVMRRRLPAMRVQDRLLGKFLGGKISQEEYDRKYVPALHNPCQKPYYPYSPPGQPLVRIAADIADILLSIEAREDIENPK